jgi:hypothetical protein
MPQNGSRMENRGQQNTIVVVWLSRQQACGNRHADISLVSILKYFMKNPESSPIQRAAIASLILPQPPVKINRDHTRAFAGLRQ